MEDIFKYVILLLFRFMHVTEQPGAYHKMVLFI